MRKKSILLLIMIIVAILAFLSIRAILLRSSVEVSELSSVELTVDPADVTSTGLTFSIINNTADTVTFDPPFFVEKRGLFGWRRLNLERFTVPAVQYIVTANSIRNVNFEWMHRYGKLIRGTYRVIVQVGDVFLAEEFTVS